MNMILLSFLLLGSNLSILHLWGPNPYVTQVPTLQSPGNGRCSSRESSSGINWRYSLPSDVNTRKRKNHPSHPSHLRVKCQVRTRIVLAIPWQGANLATTLARMTTVWSPIRTPLAKGYSSDRGSYLGSSSEKIFFQVFFYPLCST